MNRGRWLVQRNASAHGLCGMNAQASSAVGWSGTDRPVKQKAGPCGLSAGFPHSALH